jgi:hypothetical protein
MVAKNKTNLTAETRLWGPHVRDDNEKSKEKSKEKGAVLRFSQCHTLR